jgi:hypothetical protein
MGGADNNRLIDAADNRAKRLIAEALEEAASDMTALASRVRERLPKLGVRKAS